jgi:hypothetical protein
LFGSNPFGFSVEARVHFGTALKVGRILPGLTNLYTSISIYM